MAKIAGSTSKRQFRHPISQIEPQPSLQVPKRQFKQPGSQSVQQGHVLLSTPPAPEPQTIMHEPFPAPQWHFMPQTPQVVQQPYASPSMIRLDQPGITSAEVRTEPLPLGEERQPPPLPFFKSQKRLKRPMKRRRRWFEIGRASCRERV